MLLFFDKLELDNILNCSFLGDFVFLFKLDYMRNKICYIKIIICWIDELNLNGRFFFVNYLIFILLIGGISNVREYLWR